MSSSKAGPARYLSTVVQKRIPCREHFLLTLRADEFPDAAPGQFVQLLCRPPGPGSDVPSSQVVCADAFDMDKAVMSPLLRRPFSIAGLRRGANHVDFDILGRVIGAGTAWLAARAIDDVVDVLGPFGRGFQPPAPGRIALMVAGGVGLPPVRWWGEVLSRAGVTCRAIYGAQSRELLPVEIVQEPSKKAQFLPCVGEFSRDGIPAVVTTDDGTCGMKGRVTDALSEVLRTGEANAPFAVYACGPERMLEGVAILCAQHGTPCHVAMERVMGCGMATCQSCVVPVVDTTARDGWRYALCCTEGPVFDSRQVLWAPPA